MTRQSISNLQLTLTWPRSIGTTSSMWSVQADTAASTLRNSRLTQVRTQSTFPSGPCHRIRVWGGRLLVGLEVWHVESTTSTRHHSLEVAKRSDFVFDIILADGPELAPMSVLHILNIQLCCTFYVHYQCRLGISGPALPMMTNSSTSSCKTRVSCNCPSQPLAIPSHTQRFKYWSPGYRRAYTIASACSVVPNRIPPAPPS